VTSLAKLREFARDKPPVERCDLCGATLASEHAHLIEPPTRRLLCACEACGVLFSARGLSAKYRRVPRRARFLQSFEMSDSDWDSLMIPISMAFFFHSSPIEKMVALYPSPAGATESLLSLDAWEQIVKNNPVLSNLEPDIEALLVNRVSQIREYYIAPMDQCYKLVGLIRAHWRGLSGGSEVWDRIGEFFAALKERS
jgi:hypothetical protein